MNCLRNTGAATPQSSGSGKHSTGGGGCIARYDITAAWQRVTKACRSASVVPAELKQSSSLAPQAFAFWQSTNSTSGPSSAIPAMQVLGGQFEAGRHAIRAAQ